MHTLWRYLPFLQEKGLGSSSPVLKSPSLPAVSGWSLPLGRSVPAGHQLTGGSGVKACLRKNALLSSSCRGQVSLQQNNLELPIPQCRITRSQVNASPGFVLLAGVGTSTAMDLCDAWREETQARCKWIYFICKIHQIFILSPKAIFNCKLKTNHSSTINLSSWHLLLFFPKSQVEQKNHFVSDFFMLWLQQFLVQLL